MPPVHKQNHGEENVSLYFCVSLVKNLLRVRWVQAGAVGLRLAALAMGARRVDNAAKKFIFLGRVLLFLRRCIRVWQRGRSFEVEGKFPCRLKDFMRYQISS